MWCDSDWGHLWGAPPKGFFQWQPWFTAWIIWWYHLHTNMIEYVFQRRAPLHIHVLYQYASYLCGCNIYIYTVYYKIILCDIILYFIIYYIVYCIIYYIIFYISYYILYIIYYKLYIIYKILYIILYLLYYILYIINYI